MKTLRNWINAELRKINADSRFHYPPAAYQINAPLALVQVALEARCEALQEVKQFLKKCNNFQR